MGTNVVEDVGGMNTFWKGIVNFSDMFHKMHDIIYRDMMSMIKELYVMQVNI